MISPSPFTGNGAGKVATTSITKSVGYVASGTKSNQILAISGTDSDSITTADSPRAVAIHNTGKFPVVAMMGYQQYIDENTQNQTLFIHTLLLPGESIYPNMRGIISTQGSEDAQTHASFADGSLWNLDGEVVDFSAPNTALKVDTGDNVNSTELANTTALVVFEIDNGHEQYRVGDYLRIDDTAVEILKVEGTYDDNPTQETVADNHIVCSRGHLGTSAVSHDGSAASIYWAVSNEYYDYDRVLSGNTQLVQTDSLGRFKCSNFFGLGRNNGATSAFGLVPGSVCIRFYTSAYQEIPMGGTGVAGGTGGSNIPITSSTSSMLTASTEYSLNLIIDDSVETTVSFTTDSSNVNFGGTNGIIRKMQEAIDTATRTAGNNLFGYSCTVSITNSKLRFTSNSHLLPHDGANGSKMEVKDGAGGTNVLTGAAGIFPDINNSIAAVEPQLPDLQIYDSITYATSPNMANLCYDDSHGNLTGAATGKISYETGAISFTGLANASFEVSVVHNSPFSGKLDANKADANTLKSIHANTLNKNMVGKIKVETF
jgi:hypothetical protein